MAALALGFTSCKQEDGPQLKMPTTFTVATPALQNQEFMTTTEMTDAATINLFCTQPDYGYSAICKYSAIMSLDPEAPEEDWIALANQNESSAAMAIKTFEVGAGACKLLGITSAEEFATTKYVNDPVKVYFRAVCEIPGILDAEGNNPTRIVSSNAVSYNAVRLQYAEKVPAWVYIVGNVGNMETGKEDNFKGPSSANYDFYKDNFAMYEPKDKIGDKLYVGSFNLLGKEYDKTKPVDDVDQCSQFRIFTQLLGWVDTASYGSEKADFYVFPITDKFDAGYTGDVIAQGLGNWGIYLPEKADPVPMTVVFDEVQLKIYVKKGVYNVTFIGRDPEFNAPE